MSRGSSVLLALAFTACSGGATCPEVGEQEIPFNAYSSRQVVAPEPTFPHGSSGKELRIDRGAGTVTIRYRRSSDNVDVEEVWAIESTEFR